MSVRARIIALCKRLAQQGQGSVEEITPACIRELADAIDRANEAIDRLEEKFRRLEGQAELNRDSESSFLGIEAAHMRRTEGTEQRTQIISEHVNRLETRVQILERKK